MGNCGRSSGSVPLITSVAAPSPLTASTAYVVFQQEPYTNIGYGGIPQPSTDRQLQAIQVDPLSGTHGSPSVLARGVGLVSEAFAYGGGTYLLSVLTSSVQQTFFLLDSTGNPVSKAYYQTAGTFPQERLSFVSLTGSTMHMAVPVQTRVVRGTIIPPRRLTPSPIEVVVHSRPKLPST